MIHPLTYTQLSR